MAKKRKEWVDLRAAREARAKAEAGRAARMQGMVFIEGAPDGPPRRMNGSLGSIMRRIRGEG